MVLAVVQGLTEFLPISSSAHLILVPKLFAWRDQGLAFDVAVHVGTLTAVIWYFRDELVGMIRDWCLSLARRQRLGDSRLAWAVGWGTVPVGLTGLFGADFIEQYLRSPLVIATTTIGFGVLLWIADRFGPRLRDEHQLRWNDVIVIGCAQALALVPGTSRSGITITAGLALGLNREGAARFSFLLSIPLISLAGGYKCVELMKQGSAVEWNVLILGALISSLSAYLCIHLFLKALQRIGMTPFVIYRVLLGCVLVLVFW
jgi:undecaprenyl-diphosphatase